MPPEARLVDRAVLGRESLKNRIGTFDQYGVDDAEQEDTAASPPAHKSDTLTDLPLDRNHDLRREEAVVASPALRGIEDVVPEEVVWPDRVEAIQAIDLSGLMARSSTQGTVTTMRRPTSTMPKKSEKEAARASR
jgi:hypothetical protein